jgi:aminopeptidase N
MRSLINSMRWDEEAFGREYDLDLFNIVAVSDFNMGAMENKGLNVFNTAMFWPIRIRRPMAISTRGRRDRP